jgi:hypothetical protein
MSANQKAWATAFTKGTKALQSRLSLIHKNNPEFQEFIKSNGYGDTLSKKQSETNKPQKSLERSIPPVSKTSPESKDREAIIRNAAQKIAVRNAAKSSRATWGGELGGGFSPSNFGGSFRRYSEGLDVVGRIGNKIQEALENKKKAIK